MISFIKGFLGIVEPQMRFTEHVHMLVQLMGFSGPRDFFRGQNFADSFRRVWAFVASITFRSLEGVARYLGTGAACAELQRLPLMRLAKSQQMSLGPARVEETEQAQLQARGLVEVVHRYWSGGYKYSVIHISTPPLALWDFSSSPFDPPKSWGTRNC